MQSRIYSMPSVFRLSFISQRCSADVRIAETTKERSNQKQARIEKVAVAHSVPAWITCHSPREMAAQADQEESSRSKPYRQAESEHDGQWP